MSIMINGQEAFVAITDGMVDAIVRAPDRATFEAAALAVNILRETINDQGETVLIPGRGVNIDHIGAVQLSPGEYDPENNEITAPTFDHRHHVNIRMTGYALEAMTDGVLDWHRWAVAWTQAGADDQDLNASERARVLHGVALIDPASITSPTRVWSWWA